MTDGTITPETAEQQVDNSKKFNISKSTTTTSSISQKAKHLERAQPKEKTS